jgi:hypothetical protein
LVKTYNLGWVASPGDYETLNYIINFINQDDIGLEKKRNLLAISEKYFDFKKQLKHFIKII